MTAAVTRVGLALWKRTERKPRCTVPLQREDRLVLGKALGPALSLRLTTCSNVTEHRLEEDEACRVARDLAYELPRRAYKFC